MGNFSIHIQGVGAHHNPGDNPQDADRMAAEFAERLKSAGHHVEHASITFGGKQELIRTVLPPGSTLKT